MRCYDKILAMCLMKNIVSREGALMLGAKGTVTKALLSAVKNNHIRKKVITVTERNESRKQTGYVITPEGIRYLIENDLGELPWLKYADVDKLRGIKVVALSGVGAKKWERFTRKTTASIFCEVMGAQTAPIYLCQTADGECEDDSLASWVFNAVQSYEAANGQKQNENISCEMTSSDILFVESSNAKQMTSAYTDDIRRGRYVGILTNHFKAVLVYVAGGRRLTWESKFSTSEINALSIYKRIRGVHLIYPQNAGLYLVHSPDDIAALIDHDMKKGGKKKREKFGTGMDLFYAAPISEEGAAYVGWLMKTDTNVYADAIICEAVEAGGGCVNTDEATRNLFPLLMDGNLTAIGTELDILKMQQVNEYMQYHDNAQYEVICHEWEVDYWKKAIPGIGIITYPAPY